MTLRSRAWTAMMSVVAWLTVGIVSGTTAPQRGAGPALPNVQALGPQIGERVPDFTLTDQQGRPRSLASLMGPNGLMLVFFRSADW